jgi:TonB-linked SusC/RagA family outer membrane protein
MQDFNLCKAYTYCVRQSSDVLLKTKLIKHRFAVKVMKITAFILLVGFLQVSAKSPAQEKITIKEKGASLLKIFTQINKQTGYNFLFTSEHMRNAKPVDIDVKNASLKDVLDVCFKKQQLTYIISEKIITIIAKKNDIPINSENQASPPLDIHGRVVDENGKPVPGVTVSVKGAKKQTITDDNGEFSFSGVDPNAVLTFSSVNMEAFELTVGGKTEILAKLTTKTSQLDEVQIIAYGQTTKRFQTGNVTTVKGEDIQKQPVSNPLLALQGRVPGLLVTQTSGIAGGGVTVRIGGQNSIRNGNEPLYVIDGVPYPSLLLNPDGPLVNGSPLNYINPIDIESMEVLKDADATAIYGSRAANGAILITTKKGKVGKTKIDINLQQGWGKVTRKVDMLNTQQYLEMRHEAIANDGVSIGDYDYDLNGTWDTTRYTDWQKELIGGTAGYTKINAAASGGTSTIQYVVGGTYDKQTSVFPGSFSDRKGSLHFNLNSSSINQRFHLQLSANYMFDDNKLPSLDLTQQAIVLEPVAPSLYNSDGTLNWAPGASGSSTWSNPLIWTSYKDYRNTTKNLVSSALLGYTILPGLEIRSSFGYTNMQTDSYLPLPLESFKPEKRATSQRQALYHYRTLNSWIIEPQVTYKKTVYKGKLEALIGSSIQYNSNSAMDLRGSGYTSDLVMEDIRSAAAVSATSTSAAVYKYNAVFGRINYNLMDKYIINLTARRDGSSRFGGNNRFHNFGSVGAAWIFSQEQFFQQAIHFISYAKLRASYGTTGNDHIGDYGYLSLYGPISNIDVPYQNIPGLNVFRISNPELEWEETRKLQTGIELGFIKDRILLTATYVRNRSSNQLISYALPTVTGFSEMTQNFPALIQNTSWELSLSSVNIKSKNKSLSWTTNINLTIPHNKLVSFPNIEKSSYADGFGGVVVGQPLGVIKTFHGLGVDPATGSYMAADKTGSAVSYPNFPDDYNVLINTLPRFYGGVENTLTYQSFQVDFLFQFVRQMGAKSLFYYNDNGAPGTFYPVSSNQPVTVLDRWQKPGDNKPIARFNTDYSIDPYLAVGSDLGYSFDASYIRLKNVSVSWQIPAVWIQKAHLQSGRIYFQGQNLATITNYTGLDPENQTLTALPPLRVWVFGVQIGL